MSGKSTVLIERSCGARTGIGGRGNAGDHGRGGEGRLLDVCEVVGWLSPVSPRPSTWRAQASEGGQGGGRGTHFYSESTSPQAAQGEIFMRPYFGHVEDVPPIVFRLLRRHDLKVHGPRRVVALLDGIEQVRGVVEGILSHQPVSLLLR